MEEQLSHCLRWVSVGVTSWLGMPELTGFRGCMPQSLPKGAEK
jgi:hypothetical protein